MNRRTSTEPRSHRPVRLLADEKPAPASEDPGTPTVPANHDAPPAQQGAVNHLHRVFDNRSRLLFC